MVINQHSVTLGLPCLLLSYEVPNLGFPLEFRLRGPNSPDSQFILKYDGLVSGFDAFRNDNFGNIIQNKLLPYSTFDIVGEELRELIEFLSIK